jgi:hypothetical protein
MTQPYGSGSQQPPEGQPYNPQSNPPSYSQSQSGPQQQSPQGSYNPQQQGQPQQGQPYGQQNYPPQQNYSNTPPATSTATTKGRPNVGALVLAAIAAVLGVLSLFLLDWYRKDYSSVNGGNTASSNSKFSDVHDAVSKLQHLIDSTPNAKGFISFGVAPIYFSWLAYLLIAAAVVLAIIAALPTGGAVMLFKVLTAIVALAGIGLTLWAIDLFSLAPAAQAQTTGNVPNGYGDWIKHTSFGAWAMGVAFLLCLIAALIPPKRVAVVQNYGQPSRY